MADSRRSAACASTPPRWRASSACRWCETVAVRRRRRPRCSRCSTTRRCVAPASRRVPPAHDAGADPARDHETVRRILDGCGLDALLPHARERPHRPRGAAPGARPGAAGGGAVPDVPGGVRLGRGADGGDRGGDRGLGERLGALLPEGPLRSLLVDGIIAGVGSVLVFLPQILILFFFILVLEESRLPAARRLPARPPDGRRRPVGPRLHPAAVELRLRDSRHHGRAHDRQPARPAGDDHDRAADDLLGAAAGLRAADRRLHSAARRVAGGLELQGLVLFALYVAGIVGALAVAWVLKRFTGAGRPGALADDGTAELPLADAAQPRDRPVAARDDLHAPRRRHHPHADGAAVVPGELPGAAGRRHRCRRSSTASPACSAAGWR